MSNGTLWVVVDFNGWDDAVNEVCGPFASREQAMAWIEDYHPGQGHIVSPLTWPSP